MRKISLNGEWKFTKEQVNPGNFFELDWETVQVPHTWNGIDGQDGGNDYHRGQCWYQKTVTVEKTGERVYLEFEGVNSVATVLINGEVLGVHKGGYSTFRYDITDKAKEGENLIVVGADNTHYEDVYPLMADFTFYGGIYRDCHLVYTNPTSFDLEHVGTEGVYVSQKEISKEVAKFSVDSYIRNYEGNKELTVNVSVEDAEGVCLLEKSDSLNVD